MAGLGTGLAPFRAFVQYRAWEKSRGVDVGSILLYMGSRHQREEYLYGEEWEAYQAAGVVTLLGRAFSRDQPEKIYIQDRMRQSLDDIIQAYINEEGAFYLCGPTWPVPDVTEVLQEAIVEEGKRRGVKVDGAKKIEELKEGLRYVLEGMSSRHWAFGHASFCGYVLILFCLQFTEISATGMGGLDFACCVEVMYSIVGLCWWLLVGGVSACIVYKGEYRSRFFFIRWGAALHINLT